MSGHVYHCVNYSYFCGYIGDRGQKFDKLSILDKNKQNSASIEIHCSSYSNIQDIIWLCNTVFCEI